MATTFMKNFRDRMFLKKMNNFKNLKNASADDQVRWFNLVNDDSLRLDALEKSVIKQEAIGKMWKERFIMLAPYLEKATNEQFKIMLLDYQGSALEAYMLKTISHEQLFMLIKHIGNRTEKKDKITTQRLLNLLYNYVSKHGFPENYLFSEKVRDYLSSNVETLYEAERAYIKNRICQSTVLKDYEFKVLLVEATGVDVSNFIAIKCQGADHTPISDSQLKMLIDAIDEAKKAEKSERVQTLTSALYNHTLRYGFPEVLKKNGTIGFYSETVVNVIREAEEVKHQLEVIERSQSLICAKIAQAQRDGRTISSSNSTLGGWFVNLIIWLKHEGQELSVKAQSRLDIWQYRYYSDYGFKLSKEAIVNIVAQGDSQLISEVFEREDIYPIWDDIYDVLRNNSDVFCLYQQTVNKRYPKEQKL